MINDALIRGFLPWVLGMGLEWPPACQGSEKHDLPAHKMCINYIEHDLFVKFNAVMIKDIAIYASPASLALGIW